MIVSAILFDKLFNEINEIEQLGNRVEELENENKHLHKVLYALDERINILTDDKR